ncbi:MAG: N-6 DNA methylase [FCB group bacterium]|nr:N-6 DNA methylase [FCB group bacterium]
MGEGRSPSRALPVEKIRVLDPACGSGSFLIKAFDVLNEHFSSSDKNYNQSEFDYKTAIPFTTKAKILQNNIFGVDLDPKAVEIARLNLLLKITERGQRLPLLKQNIKCGNSLIDDPEIAGYKALKWEEDFKEIMGEGGFDVVISNPPWVSIKGKHKSIDLSNEELTYFYQKYQFNRYMPNIYELFIWRGLSLLKEGGFLSFIVTDRLCANRQFINLRKYIIENFSLNKLWFKVPFPAVIADTVIFVIEKQKRKNNIVEVTDYRNSFAANIPQKIFQDSPDHTFFYICKEIYDIFERIKLSNDTSPLDKIVLTTSGCGAKSSEITEQKINDSQIRILKGESISRYRIYKDFWFEFDKKNLSGRTRDERKLGKIFKVLLRKTGANLIAAFDDSKRYPEQSLYFAYTEKDNDKDTLKYILAILNSKLMNCYYGNFAITNRDSTPQLKNVDLNTFPIKQIPKSQQRPIISLVDKMLSLNQRLNQIGGKKTDERGRIEEEIQKTDDEIDQLVYKIYGITEKEKKIIEKS